MLFCCATDGARTNSTHNRDTENLLALTLPVIETTGTAWRTLAACRNTDPALFFPIGTTGPAVEQIEHAKAVCGQCPARQPCLEFALDTRQDSGVWGGLTEEERHRIRRLTILD